MSKFSIQKENSNEEELNEEDRDRERELDEDSVIELGQIALLGSSKASLRYHKSGLELNASKKSLNVRRDESILGNSRLLMNGQGGDKYKELLLDGERGVVVDVDGTLEGVDASTFMSKMNIFTTIYSKLLPFRGYILSLISTFCFCLASIVLRCSKWLTGSDHSLIRYTTTFFVMFTMLKYKNLTIMGPKNQFKLLMFRGFIGSCALISIYFAILFLKPSDLVSLSQTSLIMTAILARIFLKERLTMGHFIAILFTIVGVVLISKPSIFFEQDLEHLKELEKLACNHTNPTASTSNETLECKEILQEESSLFHENLKLVLGIFLGFLGAFSTSCVFLVLKKLNNSKVHWASNTIFVCWFGWPVSLVLSFILYRVGYSHQNFENEKKDLPMDVFYSIMSSIISIMGQIFLNLCLKYEDATKIAITRTTDVLFSTVLQYFILNILIDLLSAIGAFSIMIGSFVILIFKLFENRYEKYNKRQSVKCQTLHSDKKVDSNESNKTQTTDLGGEESSKTTIVQPSDISHHNQPSSIRMYILKFIFLKY